MKVVVLGAGAIGTASALHLAWQGHDVTVLEADHIAGRTTGLAAGILSLGVIDDTDRRLVQATIRALDAFDRADRQHAARADAAHAPLLRRPGSYIATSGDHAAAMMRHIIADAHAMGQGADHLTMDRFRNHMHSRGLVVTEDGLDDAWSLPGDAWTLSTDATTRMATAARAAGVRFRPQTRVTDLVQDGRGIVSGVRSTSGETTTADAVVVALGAWSRAFLAKHDLPLPARAYRTHAAILETPYAERFPILHDDAGGYYLRPEGPKHLLVGDGTRTDHTDPETFTTEAEASFLDDVAELVPKRFPQLGDAGLQNAWRGVLSGTPDRGALVGAHPDRQGLFLATGGNGFGFMRSWALGATLAASVRDVTGASTTGHRTLEDLVDAGMPDPAQTVTEQWRARCDPARFWPDPPSDFQVSEGFALVV